MDTTKCYHCGDRCDAQHLKFDKKNFCCNGCKTVYEIFRLNDLSAYYDLQSAAGTAPKAVQGKYDYLDTPDIVERLIDFQDDQFQIITLLIPQIHCSSCVWVLENLNKLSAGITHSQVNFPKKEVRITYKHQALSLKELVYLLAKIGYEPTISLQNYEAARQKTDRQLIYKLGVAGFAFGNVMFLSFPEYFDLYAGQGGSEFWLEQYKGLFRWLMFFFSVPVVLYAARDYFRSAYKGLRAKLLNIDVPIALGITVLFLRSTFDIALDWGSGYFDSLTGLVFFLLLGKFFQQKTYAFLSFERDYKSYFPLAVTRISPKDQSEESVQLYKIKKGDHLLIRNEEIIPADSILHSGSATIDYSFVTGESIPIAKSAGEKLFAGGKQLGGAIELEVVKPVSNSYLTSLWQSNVFKQEKTTRFQNITDSIGKRFTIAVLSIATIAAAFWMVYDPGKVMNVFTAVLIIACPCAIALAAPFSLGNILRIFGKHGFYLKNTQTIEQLAQADTGIFDKTGTISSTHKSSISYDGLVLNEQEASLLKNTLRSSSHPLSRKLYAFLADQNIGTLDDFSEVPGFGIEGFQDDEHIKVGSANFVGRPDEALQNDTAIHINANDNYKGRFLFRNEYRPELAEVFETLTYDMNLDLTVLSGDNEGERNTLEKLLPGNTRMFFKQKPEDKMQFIRALQSRDKKVLMVGDGLNDAGALAQSNVGIAVSEDINVFSPACDGILEASGFGKLPEYIKVSRKALGVVKLCFILSLMYNIVGLYFAVTGQLQPVIAAILMPLSSISVVAFATAATSFVARKIK
ncbi:heavy metal translocating P-type ATPase [Poritiphilus flavus]|uniref:HAD-IC family P-type ATPase n=1 Tax=Poritiphilus flavus TaxID=2697053 RepID=A0A6L9E768_9FLAO|nr:heavy metal translocating P-type ATPase metal-binding domain-containing protein [Poritiphilus flavus]NAS10474.1 HAD-IC family P-type ATPase [Poritiphilus flavus]